MSRLRTLQPHLPEERDALFERLDESIYILLGAVEVQAGSCGRIYAQLPMQRLCAVVPGPHCDPCTHRACNMFAAGLAAMRRRMWLRLGGDKPS